jgi:glycosyltransferase involved in cell wall biosynthesis
MKHNNLTLIFHSIEQEHLGKDVFLVPYYIGKILNMNVRIVCSQTKTNKKIPNNIRGVKLIRLKNVFHKSNNELLRNLVYIIYILFNAFTINMLMQFYFSNPSSIIGILYKTLNKKGILYIKSDGKMGEWPLLGYYNSIHSKKYQKIRTKIKKHLYKTFLEHINLITVETYTGYRKFCTEKLLDIDLKKKVNILFSGFDTEQFEKYDIKQKEYSEKENIIITVGRLGTYPKNTEMLLRTAAQINLKNWKIVLIGPIEKNECDFQKFIDTFYASNLQVRDKIIFTGAIYDKKELWKWYNRAKVFVLTSIFESFGIVLTEALFFRNYIVSTDVGSASDLIKMGYGEIIPQEDDVYLSNVLQNIIDDNKIENQYNNVKWENNDISWEKIVKDATNNLKIS